MTCIGRLVGERGGMGGDGGWAAKGGLYLLLGLFGLAMRPRSASH